MKLSIKYQETLNEVEDVINSIIAAGILSSSVDFFDKWASLESLVSNFFSVATNIADFSVLTRDRLGYDYNHQLISYLVLLRMRRNMSFVLNEDDRTILLESFEKELEMSKKSGRGERRSQ